MPLIPPEAPPPEGKRHTKTYLPLLAYIAGVFFFVLAGYQTFRQIENLIQQEKLNELNDIAAKKIGQIVSWRESQERRGAIFSQATLLSFEFEQWLSAGATANPRKQKIVQMMAGWQQIYGYHTVALVDRQGAVRLAKSDGAALDAEDVELVRQAMDGGKPMLSDIHQDSGSGELSVDLAAPLIVADGNRRRVVGAAILKINPADFLYPLIEAWPIHTSTAETLLVRQDGKDLLFLNKVRHYQDKALTLRRPVDTPDLPPGMFLRGKLDPLNSVDYRGVPVVASVARIPGTPWLMVAKIDKAELFAPIRQIKQWSAAVGLVFLAGCGALFFVWLQGSQARYRLIKAQRDAALQNGVLLKHFEYLTKYANDIIFVADENGKIVEANERAEISYGYTRDELLDMQIRDFRPQVDDFSGYDGQMARLREAGELVCEALNRRKDGSIFPVEVSARVIDLMGSKYRQAIIRDITERKEAEETLRLHSAILSNLSEGIYLIRVSDGVIVFANSQFERMFGYGPGEFLGKHVSIVNAPCEKNAEAVAAAIMSELARTGAWVGEVQNVRKDGTTFWCHASVSSFEHPQFGKVWVSVHEDITESKLVAEELSKRSEQIEDLYNNAPCGYHSLDKNGVIVQINNTELRWLGYLRDEVVGKMNIRDVHTPRSRQRLQQPFSQLKERGYVNNLAFEFIRKDGSILPVSVSETAIYDSDGAFVMSRSTVIDDTERRQAHEFLREIEARFRVMANNAPIIIWMADAQDGRNYSGCGFFNQGWHDFTGLTLAQAQERKWLELVHPDDRVRCLNSYQDSFRQAVPFKHEYRLMRHDREYRWMLDSGVPRFAEGGKLFGFIGTCIDITEQKNAEAMRNEIERVGRINIAVEMASGLAHELSQPLAAANNYLTGCLHRMKNADWDKEKLRMAVALTHKQTERAGNIINHLKNLIRKQGDERLMTDINALIRDTVDFLEHEIKQRDIQVFMALSPLPSVLVNKVEIEQVLVNLLKNAIEAMQGVPGPELRIATTHLGDSGQILVTVGDNGLGIPYAELATIFNPFHTSKNDGLGLGLSICRSLVENHGGRIWAAEQQVFGAEFNFTLSYEADHE